ncbi:hypothetical protein J2752_001000 [Halarchaeum rubridurum]|uniref:Uncharacterized protein n=1 Tax=Halarchaeum rubridurum TaxID=489911 RepID=A0A830FPD8_9EURY|nr:hypothetical protein [Halarchaeum rubridurum]MBP1954119.1 hypothetical protein [Halarchaeum rubridurum]GGM57488.1 hypothetical protein GCM10009017_04570 [Halarchaeum rubridurum]
MNEPTTRDDERDGDGRDGDGIDDPVVVDAEAVDPEDGGLAHCHDFALAGQGAATRRRRADRV